MSQGDNHCRKPILGYAEAGTIWDSGFPGRSVDPRTVDVDLLLIVEVVAQRTVGQLCAAQLPAAGFLIGLLACLRLAGGPQAAD